MQRKTVTVLFCDVTGSTALGESTDPEALRGLLARYFERMKAIVERHGGSVEKFIGDAVMAVFGVPVAHEDDALRAVRAAAEMREALPELGVQARIGVNTGEVVTGTEERLATGDAVNVAARLEQAAPPGEVLIGEPTLALVSGAVDVEPVEPLPLKGKAEPVAAYRLLRVREAPERAHGRRFVGREREVALVRDALDRARVESRCQLLTIVGDPGIGKSRLAAEALAPLDARVVRGRCLPYGEGITYWPVVEVTKQVGVLPPDPHAADAIRALLGEGDATAEDIAWAFRKLLEHAAEGRPLVALFDDIQWGEETFLDLVEHVALLSTGAPILLLCMARPELAERRPAWPVALRLEPLGEDEVEELMPEWIAGEQRERLARAAGGNPLFVTEMVAMTAEAEEEIAVPPTLRALLAARLDRLDPGERDVLQRGAVEGEIFHRGAVQALGVGEEPVTPRLAALVRRELIAPEPARVPREDGFRFRHLLIRDAAYEALPKATRAELHERFALWLEEHGAGLVELDEIVGHHLEQACRFRVELGLEDRELAAAARRRLESAAQLAFSRADYPAARRLFGRAVELLPPGELEVRLELQFADALSWAGDGPAGAEHATSVAERAAAQGDSLGELKGKLLAVDLRTSVDAVPAERLAALVAEALPVLEAAGDEFGLYLASRALSTVVALRARWDEVRTAMERADLHARRAGIGWDSLGWSATSRLLGSDPVESLLAWCAELDERQRRDRWVRGRHAVALAMAGRFAEARIAARDLRDALTERGDDFGVRWVDWEVTAQIESLAGDVAAALRAVEAACAALEKAGARAEASTAAGDVAQAYYELGELEEAEAWGVRARELGASDDVVTQMLWRRVMAKVHARRREHADGERLAREAVTLSDDTDMLDAQAGAYADLAEVLALAGRGEEAAAAFEEAVARYERKGNVVMAERVRSRLQASGTAR